MGPLLHLTILLLHSFAFAAQVLPTARLELETSARGPCAELHCTSSKKQAPLVQHQLVGIDQQDDTRRRQAEKEEERELFTSLLSELGLLRGKSASIFSDLLQELEREEVRVKAAGPDEEERVASITEEEVIEALEWDWPASPSSISNGRCSNADRTSMVGLECGDFASVRRLRWSSLWRPLICRLLRTRSRRRHDQYRASTHRRRWNQSHQVSLSLYFIKSAESPSCLIEATESGPRSFDAELSSLHLVRPT